MGKSSKRKLVDDRKGAKQKDIKSSQKVMLEKETRSSLAYTLFGNVIKDESISCSLFGFTSDNNSNLFDNEKSKAFRESVHRRKENNLKMIDPIVSRLKREDSSDHKQLINLVRTDLKDEAVKVMIKYGVAIISSNSDGSNQCIPYSLLMAMSKRGNEIENEVCAKLDEIGSKWRAPLNEDTAIHSSFNLEGEDSFRYEEVASRCLGRLDVRRGTKDPPFNDPSIVSNEKIMGIVRALLGNDAKLLYCGLIYSMPNSADQPWHQDGTPLFNDNELNNIDLPTYALNVFIPLHEITQDLGPTEFFLGSHLRAQAQKINEDISKAPNRFPLIAPSLSVGDILIYDYRTCHRGTRNLSGTSTRTMLYLMYARPWFAEHLNFGSTKLFEN